MFLFLLFYGIAYLICCIGLIGVTKDHLESRLLTGYRSWLQETVKAILRLLVKILGFTDFQVVLSPSAQDFHIFTHNSFIMSSLLVIT